MHNGYELVVLTATNYLCYFAFDLYNIQIKKKRVQIVQIKKQNAQIMRQSMCRCQCVILNLGALVALIAHVSIHCYCMYLVLSSMKTATLLLVKPTVH